MGTIIEAENLSCKIGQGYLIKDINWAVKEGEQWIVYGMNGSGKTTLLSIMAGYKHYTSGNVKLFDENLCGENVLALRKQTGFVSSSFFDKQYSRENVLDIVLSGKTGSLGLDEKICLDDVVFARKLLKGLHIGDKIERQFDLLSKGERQSVLLARALINKPKLLILDEPMSGLDIYNREYFFHVLGELQNKITMIYVTHHAEEISGIFSHCLLLKQGRVFGKGAMEETFTSDNISRLLEYPAAVEVSNRGRRRIALEITASKIGELL